MKGFAVGFVGVRVVDVGEVWWKIGTASVRWELVLREGM